MRHLLECNHSSHDLSSTVYSTAFREIVFIVLPPMNAMLLENLMKQSLNNISTVSLIKYSNLSSITIGYFFIRIHRHSFALIEELSGIVVPTQATNNLIAPLLGEHESLHESGTIYHCSLHRLLLSLFKIRK
jgi:hypothetical protein